MSNRRKSSNRPGGAGDKSGQPFEIKHRIAGAVVLMLVAIVVIPMLLSEPAVEASNSNEEVTGRADRDFKSRIVPLDIDKAGSGGAPLNGQTTGQAGIQDSTIVNVDDTTVIDDSRPALLDLTKSDSGDSPDMAATSDVAQEQSDSGQTDPGQSDSDAGSDAGKTKSPQTVVMTANAESNTDTKAATTSEQAAGQPADQSSNEADAPEQPVQVASIEEDDVVKQGWVVRVGTFSKEENVQSVSTILTSSGFKPKNTPVTTSLGPSTRVWLGPYAKRETADKISNRLKSLTGEKGYVTKTSS